MSYQEKTIYAYLATHLIIFGTYGLILYNMCNSGRLDGPGAAILVGKSILLLIAASIVINIVVQILLSIINAIITKEYEHPESDERDQLIELKGIKFSYIVFGIGFILSMGILAFGSLPIIVINLIVFCMAAGEIAGNLTKLFYYRRGF